METILGNMILGDILNMMKRAKSDLTDNDYVCVLEEVNKLCESEAHILYKQAQKELQMMNNSTGNTIKPVELDKVHDVNMQEKIDSGFKLPVDPIGDKLNRQAALDLLDKNEITEDEYNELFQSDAKDQFNEVEEDITKRSAEYGNGRPLDP